MCVEANLIIGGTLFPHKDIHKYTWTSPDGQTRNQIDHICISKQWRQILLDVRTKRGAALDTDHTLVVAELRMKLIRRGPRGGQTLRRLNLDGIAQETKRNALLETIQREERLSTVNTRKYCEDILGYTERVQQTYISAKSWALINIRNNELRRLVDVHGADARNHIRELCVAVKRSVRSDKRQHLNQLAQQAEDAARRGDLTTVHKCTQQLTGARQRTAHGIRNEEGTLITDPENELSVWQRHFMSTAETNAPTAEASNCRDPLSELEGAPTVEEVTQAIIKLKTGKTPGEDGIPGEILKLDPHLFAEKLLPLLREIWRTEQIPTDWKTGLIIKLPKKGDLTQCGNWRGITLLNSVMKVLATIVHDRIYATADSKLRDEQNGFRRSRGCAEHITAIRNILEQASEHSAPLLIVFVDFKRAFDMLKHDAIWEAMRAKGIEEKMVRISRAMYMGADSKVVHKGLVSGPIPLTRGVRQGCPLSPLLFTITLDEALQKAFDRPRGIQLTPFEHLESLEYADDLSLIATNQGAMERKLKRLVEECHLIGLEINVGKTKMMCSPSTPEAARSISVNGQAIECVDRYVYLGSVMTPHGGDVEDAEQRVRTARVSFAKMGNFWGSEQISRNLKIRMLNAYILPALLYGCESWSSKTALNKVQALYNRCLRTICRVYWPDKISNIRLWETTGQPPIVASIERRRWSLFGHLSRRRAKSLRAALWRPPMPRRRGRPSTTLQSRAETLLTTIGVGWREWQTMAADREGWRQMTDEIVNVCTNVPAME
jgi:sorting nexin-29